MRNSVPFYNFKNVKNTHDGVLLLACNFIRSNTPPWVFLTFSKLYNLYVIAQHITNTVEIMLPNGRNITTDGEEVVKVFNNQYVNNVEKSCRRKPDHIARDNNY